MTLAPDIYRVGAAAVVTLRRPERRNALGPDDALALAEAIEQAGQLPDLCGLVLTGEGAFCAGGDLPSITARIEGMAPTEVAQVVYTAFQRMVRALRDCPVPTAAAVDGPAIGLGLDLALWCDRRFFGTRAVLGQGWAAAGLLPGTGGAHLLQALAPGLLWSLLDRPGGRLEIDEAVQRGLGEKVEDARTAAVDWIARLAQTPGPAACRGYASLARTHLPDDDYLALCAQLQSHRLTAPDFADRVAAGLAARRGPERG